MKIENQKVVKAIYEMYVDGEEGKEEMIEKATIKTPLVYCQGEGMMLPKFEEALAGLEERRQVRFPHCLRRRLWRVRRGRPDGT